MNSQAQNCSDLPDPRSVLSLRGVTFSYNERRRANREDGSTRNALEDISFDVSESATVAIIGETGSGKSTLAKVVTQQVRASKGSICYRGKDLLALRGRELSRAMDGMAMVFQDSYASLDPHWTVAELVEETLQARGVPARSRRSKANDILEFVGLTPSVYRNAKPMSLSGGQCQRVAIARALVGRPNLLIADEPTAALDVSVQAQIVNLLLKASSELDVAMLFISHDLMLVRHISDEIVVLYGGNVCERGRPTEEVVGEPAHPYTAGLMGMVGPGREDLLSLRPLSDVQERGPAATGCWYQPRCPIATEVCVTTRPELLPRNGMRATACHHPLVDLDRTSVRVSDDVVAE